MQQQGVLSPGLPVTLDTLLRRHCSSPVSTKAIGRGTCRSWHQQLESAQGEDQQSDQQLGVGKAKRFLGISGPVLYNHNYNHIINESYAIHIHSLFSAKAAAKKISQMPWHSHDFAPVPASMMLQQLAARCQCANKILQLLIIYEVSGS